MEARNYIEEDFEDLPVVEKPVATSVKLHSVPVKALTKPYQQLTPQEEKLLNRQKREVKFFGHLAAYGLGATFFLLLFLSYLPFLIALPLGVAFPYGLSLGVKALWKMPQVIRWVSKITETFRKARQR